MGPEILVREALVDRRREGTGEKGVTLRDCREALDVDQPAVLVELAQQGVEGGRVGVRTDDREGWRGRGFATAAACLVSQAVQAVGLTPVWSTGEDNYASQRIAEKLGFTQIVRRTYVIPTPAYV